MASINPETAWEFADAIKSVLKLPTTRRRATVQSVDKDGTIWVQLPGSSNVTPIASTGANVAPGDTVLTELRGTSLHITENNTDPAVGTRQAGDIARQAAKPAVDAARAAHEIADEANAVAQATNQHFFADDNGAHVTDVTQDEWTAAAADDFSDLSDAKPYHNLLMNSLGILLRRALNNLVSISKSAIAFYDGLGNTAANIVARFGADGAQIGATDESHMELDYHSLRMYDLEGSSYLHVSDLRERNGTTEIVEWFRGDGTTTQFGLLYEATSTDYVIEVPAGRYGTITKTTTSFTTEIAPPAAVHFRVVYQTSSEYVKAFTFGNRSSAYSVGGMSFTAGHYASAGNFGSAAIGSNVAASGRYAFAQGAYTHSDGTASVAMGYATQASADYSFAQNYRTIAASKHQTVIGRRNVEDSSDTYAFIIGNGTSDTARSNAFAMRWDGTCDVGNMQSVSGDNHAYPLFIWTSSMTNPESYSGTYPVSPCFVYYVPNNGLYYCEN